MERSLVDELGPVKDWAKPGWVDCLRWASANSGIVGQFCAATGNTVGNVTQSDQALGFEFARWFNANIWGEVKGRACNGDED